MERVRDAVLSGVTEEVTLEPEGMDFEQRIAEIEKQYLTQALVRATGVRTKAAELLKMSYRSFRHYAQKHQI